MKRIKIFGFHIWISREPLRVAPRKKNKTNYRSSQRNIRLEKVGGVVRYVASLLTRPAIFTEHCRRVQRTAITLTT